MFLLSECVEKYDEIGEGSSRIVFGMDNDWVIKLPITYGGHWQNQNEINFYKKYKNTALPLCPIDLSKSTENYIVMKRATPLSELEDEETFLNDFDLCIGRYVEDCTSLYNTHIEKKTFIDELFISGLDQRLIKFMQKLTKFKSSTIETLFYDVCYFNCGLVDNDIVVVDYGYPATDEKMGGKFYEYTTEYNTWFNK